MGFTDRRAHDHFEFHTREIARSIENRMLFYEQALWGAVGLFDASGEVNRDEWSHYIEAIQINDRLPGIQGIGFAVQIAAEDLEAHITAIRAEGFPDYSIIPPGSRSEYTAVVYLAPFDFRNRRAFGYDMWTDEIRRDAMRRTRDLGTAATSGMVTLVQEADEDIQRGFLTYTPVYTSDLPESPTAEQRRTNFIGWVYAPFRARDLMRDVFGGEDHAYQIQIYDSAGPPSDTRLLFDSAESGESSAPVDRPKKTLSSAATLSIQGRPWTLHAQSTPEFNTGNPPVLPVLMAISGLIVSSLLFIIARSAHNINRQATERARYMTAQISEKSRKLEIANTQLRQFAYAATHDVKTPINHVGNALHLLQTDGHSMTGQQSKAIGWLQSAHRRATEILDKLMEIVQLNEGERMSSSDFDVAEAIERRLDFIRPGLTEIGAHFDTSQCTGRLHFPPEIFARVIDNLFSNAIKYRAVNRPLKVFVTFTEHPEGSVIAVEDNGIGINLTKHEDKIFGLFKRAHDHVEGSGFGLYIAKQLVEVYDGKLSCSSEEGVGSCFSVSFPSPKNNIS